MTNEELAQDLLKSARELIDSGLLGEVMDILLKVDELDGSRAKETTNMRHEVAALQQAREQEETSAGISSLTSESKLDMSGSGTGTLLPSPVPDAENLYDKGPALKPALSSVSLTDGSGQETSFGQVSQPVSLEGSALPKPATADLPSSAAEAVEMARKAFDEHNYDAADGFLDMAATADATMLPDIQRYRASVASARQAAQQTASEETPSAGGFVAGGTVS